MAKTKTCVYCAKRYYKFDDPRFCQDCYIPATSTKYDPISGHKLEEQCEEFLQGMSSAYITMQNYRYFILRVPVSAHIYGYYEVPKTKHEAARPGIVFQPKSTDNKAYYVRMSISGDAKISQVSYLGAYLKGYELITNTDAYPYGKDEWHIYEKEWRAQQEKQIVMLEEMVNVAKARLDSKRGIMNMVRVHSPNIANAMSHEYDNSVRKLQDFKTQYELQAQKMQFAS